MAEAIRIDGLDEFVRALKRLDAELPKAMRLGFNQAAKIVIDWAQPRVPRRTGQAQASIKPRSLRNAVRVAAGGKRAGYYPWLDFGGKTGPHKSVHRAFLKDGRYLYQALYRNHDAILTAVQDAVTEVARQAGIEVD